MFEYPKNSHRNQDLITKTTYPLSYGISAESMPSLFVYESIDEEW